MNAGSDLLSTMVCWLNVVQYLLRIHAIQQAIRQAVEHLENLRKAPNQDENTFASRVVVATIVAARADHKSLFRTPH